MFPGDRPRLRSQGVGLKRPEIVGTSYMRPQLEKRQPRFAVHDDHTISERKIARDLFAAASLLVKVLPPYSAGVYNSVRPISLECSEEGPVLKINIYI